MPRPLSFHNGQDNNPAVLQETTLFSMASDQNQWQATSHLSWQTARKVHMYLEFQVTITNDSK